MNCVGNLTLALVMSACAYQELILVPAGTRLGVSCAFDV